VAAAQARGEVIVVRYADDCATTPVTPTPNALGSSRRFGRHSSISILKP